MATEEAKANSIQEFSTDLLRVYYGRLFPYTEMFNWLSYGQDPHSSDNAIDKDYFSHREWSFTIEDDIYIRYQSFKDKDEMIAAIQKRQPHKIDIGAVFTGCPKDHNTIKPDQFKPIERELVFDIDMTDYDDIRTCCSGAEICNRCWPYMTMAIKVIDRGRINCSMLYDAFLCLCFDTLNNLSLSPHYHLFYSKALRDDFAFRHIVWIYSGRRGVHCWVCDKEARILPNDARGAIVEYLSIETGISDNSDKQLKNTFQNPHPMMIRAYEILEPCFSTYIADGEGQGLLARKDRYMKVLNSLPNEHIRVELYEKWEKNDTLSGADRWRDIKIATTPPSIITDGHKRMMTKHRISYQELKEWRMNLIFTHCYARLDANVTKTQNHLLKSAYCIHPKTGRVCVPIDPKDADNFDPFSVPTVRSLCAEIDEYDRLYNMNYNDNNGNNKQPTTDTEKTSLQDSLRLFKDVFWNDMRLAISKELRSKKDNIAAYNMDF